MFDKPTSLHTIGLEQEGSTIKAAQLTLVKGKPSLDRTFEIAFTHTSVTDLVNPLYMSDEGQLLRERLHNHLIVTALDTNDVLVRPLEIKLKKDRDIDAVLSFQAEPLLPYSVDNAILDRITLAQTQEGTLLNLVAARKDHIKAHLEQWGLLQIEPEVVSCVPMSLTQFGKLFSPTADPHFIVHLGHTQTTCVLVKGGLLLAAQGGPTGLQAFKDAAGQDSLDNVDFSALTKQQNGALFEVWENWRLEVTRILYALARQRKEQEVTGILFTGEGAALNNLGPALSQSLEKSYFQPVENPLFPISVKELQKFAIPIGSAISGLPNQEQINFRQQELAYPRPWKRLTKTIALYYALSIALAAALYLFGNTYLGYREDQVRQEYVDLLGTMNKTYPDFEKEYSRKQHSLTEPEGGEASPKNLSQEQISNRLQYLQKEVKDSPDLFPLQPNTPRVSDVLAWLSTHPIVTGKASDNTESPIQIDNFSYTMMKRPDPKKAQEKYQVKVELEFSTPTPKLAREFHDSLIAPNDIVDPKGEVKWSSNKGKYRTSFFLKDKTGYPSSLSLAKAGE